MGVVLIIEGLTGVATVETFSWSPFLNNTLFLKKNKIIVINKEITFLFRDFSISANRLSTSLQSFFIFFYLKASLMPSQDQSNTRTICHFQLEAKIGMDFIFLNIPKTLFLCTTN